MTTFRGPPATSERFEGPFTLGGFLTDLGSRHADRDALVFHGPSGVVRWTFSDLLLQARGVARALMGAGLAPGERVAVLMGNRPEWLGSVFGVALAGGVAVPLNTYLEPPERSYVLEHSDAAMLLMQDRLLGHAYVDEIASQSGTPSALRAIACLGIPARAGAIRAWDSFLAGGASVSDAKLDARAASVSPDDDGVIIYTSGTTANPKGVLHPHRVPVLQSRRFVRHLCLDSSVRSWSAFPFFWTAGFAMVMGATLAAGGCLVLQEAFSPGEALGLLQEERVTTPHAWPHQLAELEEHPDWGRTDLSALRHVESFSSFGRHPSVRVPVDGWSSRGAYGLTETFTIISAIPSDSSPEVRDRAHGRILPGNSIRILHPASGEPQPAGADGEIAVAGPTLMRTYVKIPPSETFDPDGFFRTGDAGYVDDEGFLHWTGRTTDMIKTGGANVSPVEIELELLHHPGLVAAGAVGVPHPTLGQMVVVVAVAHEGSQVDEENVRRFLRGRLASYKIPRRVLFVSERDLSLTANAKIRPEELRSLAAERLADR